MSKFDFANLRTNSKNKFAVAINTESELVQLLAELKAVGAEAESLIQQNETGDRSLIVCGAGCQHCCVVNVSITLLEGIAIARSLHELADDVYAQVKLRLDKLWRDVRGLDDDERLVLQRKCAFLDEDGCCIIYPTRPLFCRSISSADVDACRDAVAGPTFGEVKPVLMHQFQLQIYKVLYAAVGAGLEEAVLDGRSFQMCGLVRYLLNNPGAELQLLTASTLCWNDLYP